MKQKKIIIYITDVEYLSFIRTALLPDSKSRWCVGYCPILPNLWKNRIMLLLDKEKNIIGKHLKEIKNNAIYEFRLKKPIKLETKDD